MKCMKWTLRRNYPVTKGILAGTVIGSENGIILKTSNQNYLRHVLALLDRLRPWSPDPSELLITLDNNEYCLYVRSYNFSGHSSFIAGLIHGNDRIWKRLRRKRNRKNLRKTRNIQ